MEKQTEDPIVVIIGSAKIGQYQGCLRHVKYLISVDCFYWCLTI